MLHDRDYMRDAAPSNRLSLTVTLIILLIGLFVLQCILMLYARLPLDEWFALSVGGFRQKHYWQLLTFQFMHAYPWPWHVLFNCLGLYFFGRTVEETLGRKEFLLVYFSSGVLGGVLQLLITWLVPLHEDIPVVGASAGICGLIAVYCTLYPMRELTYFFYFFPVTIRARYFFWIIFAFSLFGTIIPYDMIANAAHLGGLLTGVAYVKWRGSAQAQLSRWKPFKSRQRKLELVKAASVRVERPGRSKRDVLIDLPSEEFISKEVDPILDKISAHGIQSLTERERQILEAARARMSKR